MKPSFDDAYCRLAANYAKNYCNRTPIVKVIVENVVTCVFGTQCILQRLRRCGQNQRAVNANSGAIESPETCLGDCMEFHGRCDMLLSNNR